MPAPKRSSSPSKSSSAAKPAAKPAAKRTSAAAKRGAKATATTTRKAASRTATQAKSGATKTTRTARAGSAKTKRAAAAGGKRAAAKPAAGTAKNTAKTARAGTRGTATAARRGAKGATGGSESIASVVDQLARGTIKPRDVVLLTRDRVQEALDVAVSRGHVTRKDANELVAELVRRGRSQGDDILGDIERAVGRGRTQVEAATRKARKSEPVDRALRGADRARRAVGVGPKFPILGYDDLTASQVQSRLSELKKADLRKVLTYERNNANRKSVVGALEKAIG